MGLPELRAVMESHGVAWSRLLGELVDADAVVVSRHDDGSETHATIGIRLAQTLHQGTDHRSQICTALTTLGVEPPAIDVWDFGLQNGRVADVRRRPNRCWRRVRRAHYSYWADLATASEGASQASRA